MVRPAERAQIRLGDTTITYLPDGHGRLDPAVFFPSSQPDGWATHAAYLDEDGWFPVSVGSFLVRTPDQAVLVDLGLGAVDFAVPDLASFRGGRLLDSLAAEGLGPGDVDTVFFTHLHHDHVGWTSNVAPAPNAPADQVVEGLTFARARHVVAEAEWNHWAGTAELVGPDPAAVQAPLADRLTFVADGDEIAPGVSVLATPGHTPGHSSLRISDPSGRTEQRLVVLGDVMHCQVQVTESSWSFLFDHDAEQGVRTREQLLKELEDPAVVLAGGHFAGHVFGRVLPPVARRAWASGR
jgi:glyoxylase-like metal-dependent hydrolase (beta-lactamase superfamily II)